MAARYDANALIRSVAVSSCATLTAEPFIMSLTASVRAELFADGWSPKAEQGCLDGAFADYSGWKHTHRLRVQPVPDGDRWRDSSDGRPVGHRRGDGSLRRFDLQLAPLVHSEQSRADQNSGIASRVGAAQVYAEINALYEQHRGRTPVDFQTYGPISLFWCQAIAIAVAHHAQSVELWPPSACAPGYGAFRSPCSPPGHERYGNAEHHLVERPALAGLTLYRSWLSYRPGPIQPAGGSDARPEVA